MLVEQGQFLRGQTLYEVICRSRVNREQHCIHAEHIVEGAGCRFMHEVI